MVNKILNVLLDIKMVNKSELYAHSFQKWVHIDEILIKLNVCLFRYKIKNFLKQYNQTWKKFIRIIKKKKKKKNGSKLLYNEKYLKPKTKSYNGKINTNFYNDKIPKEGSQCICLSVILIDPVYRKYKDYYPQE